MSLAESVWSRVSCWVEQASRLCRSASCRAERIGAGSKARVFPFRRAGCAPGQAGCLFHPAAVAALALLITTFINRGALAEDAPRLIPALGWTLEQQGGFPTSLAADAQNAIWAGTEGRGVWRYEPREKKWTQFTTKDGLGDDCIYALAVDKQNRVWAGHLNRGVSVWNGEKWKNYGLLDGPLGDRVFDIEVSPVDGDVWIATDLGLSRYSIAKEEWDYYTCASGLPTNQIQCLAFDQNGDVFLGTQCEGVALADAAAQYRGWRLIEGPARMPNTSSGTGLPSSLINDIAVVVPRVEGLPPNVAMIGVATPWGIGGSADRGKMWGFLRGADWQINVAGLYDSPPPETAGRAGDEQFLPLEDWVTCLRFDEETNHGWAGYRKKGVESRDFRNGKTVVRATGETEGMLVRSILLAPKAPPLMAIYDEKNGGLKTVEESASAGVEPLGAESPAAALPVPAKPPTIESFTPLTERVLAFQNVLQPGEGAFLGDDWRTQGDWIGRYGNSFAMICGVEHGGRIFAGEPGYSVEVRTGPHLQEGGGPVSYIGEPDSQNPSVLYDPTSGRRSAAEVNDGSFDSTLYPADWDGPDLWVETELPEGSHCVSLYFHNNDAQKKDLRKFRDYDVQVLLWSDDPETIQKSEFIARARVTDFCGGVYKSFILAGPRRFVIRIGRNRSFVTKLQGVFIDRLTGEFPKKREPLPGFESISYAPLTFGDLDEIRDNPVVAAAAELWTTLDEALDKPGTIGLQLPLRIWAYRAAVAANAPEALLTTWRWQIGIWTDEDRREFKEMISKAFESKPLQDAEPAEPAAPDE